MEQLVLLNEDKYMFKSRHYNDNELEDLTKKIGKNLKIIILDNNIFIQCFKDINTNVQKYMEDEFISKVASDIDRLIHYNYLRKYKTLYVYSINNGVNIKKILPNVTNLKIIPIQFIIQNYVSKKIKNRKSIIIITLVKDNVHIINCENRIIISCEMLKVKEFKLENIVDENSISKQIIIDKKIIDSIPAAKDALGEITILDIGRYLNEKIFKV